MNLMQHWKTLKPLYEEPGEGTPPASDPPATPPADPPAADYSFLPEQFRSGDEPDLEGFKNHYDEMAARQAVLDENAADVPEDATGYEFAVPEELDFGELELPKDFAVELKTDDPVMAPLFESLGGFMHKHNIPKAATGDLMQMLAQYEAAKYSKGYVQANEEFKSLGSAADSRVAAVERLLETKLPADLAGALKAATQTAGGVKALERLLSVKGPGTAPPQPAPASSDDDLSHRYNS